MKWMALALIFTWFVVLTPEQAQLLFKMKIEICPRGTSTIDMTGDGSTDLIITGIEPRCNLQLEKEFRRELKSRPTQDESSGRGRW